MSELLRTATFPAVRSPLSLAVGVLVTMAAAVTPSSALAGLLAPGAADASQLLVGATLFRIGLAILGVTAAVLPQLPMWHAAGGARWVGPDANRGVVFGALAVILLAATALRLYALDAGLWLDEILTHSLFASMPLGTIVTSYESENQHFLYSVLAHLSLNMFGDGAWALRLPAALFGVGSIWALYVLGRQLTGVAESLFASALLAFSYTHVWFSQNARGYSGLLFFTIVSSWLLLKASREGRPQLWILYGAAVALGAYMHVTMLFVVLGHFLMYVAPAVFRRVDDWAAWWAGLFLGFGSAGLLTFELHALVLPQLLTGVGREESVVEAWKNPLWTVFEVVQGLQISFAGGAIAIAALAVFGAGIVSYARTKPELIQLLIVPAAIGAIVVVGLGHHLWPRFFFFAMGFGALVVVRGAMVWGTTASELIGVRGPRSMWIGATVCVALIAASFAAVPFAYGPKQDYVGAAAYVEANQRPGDVVVTAGLAALPYRSYFGKDWPEVATAAELETIRAGAERTWLVYTFPPVLEAVHPDIMARIGGEFQIVKQFNGTVGGGTIYLARSERGMP